VKELYAVGVNAIVHHTDSSGANAPQAAEIQSNIVIFGQKTLLRANTVMSRLDVRKLLIAIRRRTRQIAMNYLFEPNQPSVLQAFSSDVDNYLSGLQSQGAVQQYRVVIDETTTSQADIENNTVRGKVFVQPIGSVEIISLDLGIVNDFEE
jgi:phage tail sheath protein FI